MTDYMGFGDLPEAGVEQDGRANCGLVMTCGFPNLDDCAAHWDDPRAIPAIDHAVRPDDCVGVCGHDSRCYAYQNGAKAERARIMAIIEPLIASHKKFEHSSYRQGKMDALTDLLPALGGDHD
jgi:hypothetical protein